VYRKDSECIEIIEKMGEDIDNDDDDRENNNKTGNSKDNAIAIDQTWEGEGCMLSIPERIERSAIVDKFRK
jgi:hypothetical protein